MFRGESGGVGKNLMGSKRRGMLYIIAEILEIARKDCLKCHIMYGANLSFAQLNEYLGILLETKLLKATNEGGRHVYRRTRKGVRFLKNYYKMMDLLRRESVPKLLKPSLFSTVSMRIFFGEY